MKYNWENIDNIAEEENREWQIDYSEKTGMYRVSEFLNNHFQNEIIFKGKDKDKNMSNEYKEWEQDRAKEAWDDIDKISHIFLTYDNEILCSDKEFIKKIADVLEEGGWI